MDKGKKCSKAIREDNYVDLLTRVIYQFFKSLFLLGLILMLVLIRKSLRDNLTIAKGISYLLIASLAMATIYMVDNYVYNNLILGIGVYFGYSLMKLA